MVLLVNFQNIQPPIINKNGVMKIESEGIWIWKYVEPMLLVSFFFLGQFIEADSINNCLSYYTNSSLECYQTSIRVSLWRAWLPLTTKYILLLSGFVQAFRQSDHGWVKESRKGNSVGTTGTSSLFILCVLLWYNVKNME